MIKKYLIILITIFITCNYSYSLENKEEKKYKIGFGSNLKNTHYYFPVNIKNKFRIEIQSIVDNHERNIHDYSSQSFRFGLGIFKLNKYDKTIIYWGTRFGYYYRFNNYPQGYGSNNTIFISPIIGGEYYPVNRFSLGIELNPEFCISKQENKNITPKTKTINFNSFSTKAEFIMRFYIF